MKTLKLVRLCFFCLLSFCFISAGHAMKKDFNTYLDSMPIERGQKTWLVQDFKHAHKMSKNNAAHIKTYTERYTYFYKQDGREELIKSWETKTKKTWPVMDNRVTQIGINRGLSGFRYEVHHLIPLLYNGKNDWRNIVPLTPLQHQEAQEKGGFWSTFR